MKYLLYLKKASVVCCLVGYADVRFVICNLCVIVVIIMLNNKLYNVGYFLFHECHMVPNLNLSLCLIYRRKSVASVQIQLKFSQSRLSPIEI